jgi:uncharacterized protein YkwD
LVCVRWFENQAFMADMLSFLLLLILGPASETNSNEHVFAETFMTSVNNVRRSGCTCEGQKMSPAQTVRLHPKLEITASLHAQQMMRYRFFEHYSRGGMDIGERAHKVGYEWRTIGENLARGQASIPEVINAWIRSPEHCRVLMNPKFKELGAARVGQYWVLHLGTRKEAR